MRLFLLIAFGLSLALQAEQKIGVVDLERALNEVADGQAAKTKLQDEFKKKQDMLDKKQNELKKLQDNLQSKASMLTEKARQEKAMEFQTKYAEAQQVYQETQQEFVKKQQEVMGDILKKMNPIVRDIAQKEGYSIVLNKTDATVVFAQANLDVTDEVIKRYNTAYPSKTKKK
jgi:outer membrane protein